VLYRPDIFKAAGINTYPATWNEFLKANQTLQDKGMKPLLYNLTGNDASLWWELTPSLEARLSARHGEDQPAPRPGLEVQR